MNKQTKNRQVSIARFCFALIAVLGLLGCGQKSDSEQGQKTTTTNESKDFVILSGSENDTLEPLVKAFGASKGYNVKFVYKGSIDIMQLLKTCQKDKFDAVWPASSIWITMGDTQHCVKNVDSVMVTPVTFNVSLSKARAFGWIGKPVKVADIAAKIRAGELRFMMTSATQSNSGASAYIGFLYALAGNPEVLTKKDLDNPKVREGVKEILSGVNRSAGSSGWLKTAFIEGNYNAMVNYESVAIETNQALVALGREPLYAVYPVDGMVLADSPLGFIPSADTSKEAFFKEIKSFLSTPETVESLAKLGRRAGFDAMNVPAKHPSVFKPEWGMGGSQVISPIKLPQADVIEEALLLYQAELRKPSMTVFVLDYSGSMRQNGGELKLKQAMAMILDPLEAKRYWLQTTAKDVIIVIPFSSQPMDQWVARGPRDLETVLNSVTRLPAEGGTAIYASAIAGINTIKQEKNLESYTVSMVLMTDGENTSGENFDDFKQFYEKSGTTIPIYTIGFGKANSHELNAVATLSHGAHFDAGEDLVGAFRKARGYN